ncbi:peptidase M19 [Hydrogenophaga crassostreae]|uniref:Peptidase M19 n=1 Tax=Hydrogenophaga crassostreae TaxID=1763535 RepID=A0A162PC87_9BURK|nr:membrane dipeptidase [Hydrogenophaga crassostreae]AOW14289.1 peptidase M19 [Hydrogenophaga crassostreae]OAD43688.1 peptidase M19 [Hydrogenophaga crassostreae]
MIHWEAHTCLPLHPEASFEPLDRYRALGVHYVSINVGMDMNPLSQILPVIAAFRARLAAEPERYVLPKKVSEIESARVNGQLAVGFDLEGALPLLEQPAMVALFRDLGVRQIHFAYNRNNAVAGGCHDTPQGLTALGRRMVDAVNDAGVLMDCAHTERRSSLDIMARSRHPVVFSHANPLALAEHGRNVSDEQIRACAATGGVVCLSGVSPFLGIDQPGAIDVARHAAYVADLVGAEHVGLGLDIGFSQSGLTDDPPPPFDPGRWWPAAAGYGQGIRGITYTPLDTWSDLPQALQAAGMRDTDIRGVMGGNMARVARHVWGG